MTDLHPADLHPAVKRILDKLHCADQHNKRVKRMTITRSMAEELTRYMLDNLAGGLLTLEELEKEIPPIRMAPKKWAKVYGVDTYVRPDITLTFERGD